MVQRIVTVCDVHAQADEQVGGLPWEVTITEPGGRPVTYVIDLCEEDGKPLVALVDHLEAVGRTEGPKRRRPAASAPVAADPSAAPEPCPVEGCDAVPRTRGALLSHLRSRHHMTLGQAQGRPLIHECPECREGFAEAKGLGAHRRMVHGVVGSSSSAVSKRALGAS